MNIRYYKILLILSILFSSCVKTEDITDADAVCLRADVTSLAMTRSADDFVYTGTSAAGMEAEVWFSNESGIYPANGSPVAPTFIPYRAKVKYEDANPTTVYVNPESKTDALSYPVNGEPVYCVGLYPAGKWTSPDGTKAIHPIDGRSDIMYASQLSGTWQNPLPIQHYFHKLTWLKVEGRATDPDAIDNWGKILSISIVNPCSNIEITLSDGAVNFTGEKKDLVALDTATGLSVTVRDMGSLICTPDTEYEMKIVTEKSTKTVSVTLKDESGKDLTAAGEAMGKLFIINLYFTPFNEINASCVLIPWFEQEVELN